MANSMKYESIWRFCFKAEKWRYSCEGKLGHITKTGRFKQHRTLKVFKKKGHMTGAIL